MNKITNIEVQKRNQKRVNVYVDEEFSFACDAEIVYRQGLKKGETIDLVSIKEIVNEDEFIKCKNSALRIVEKAYKTEKEIKDKLVEKGFPEAVIKRTFEFLEEYNLLDDKRYADMYVKDKIKNQGRNKIKYSLIRKGVSEELIEEKISSIDVEDEKEIAFVMAKKKYEMLCKREPDQYKLSQKLFRFLIGKGYSFDCSNAVVKRIIKNNEFME